HLLSDRPALGMVGLKERGGRTSLQNQGELPGGGRCVLEPPIHPPAAGWTVGMGGVAPHENAADLIFIHPTVMKAIACVPNRVPQGDVGTIRIAKGGLDPLKRNRLSGGCLGLAASWGRRFISGTTGDDAANVLALERQEHREMLASQK